ncbi:ABC transporter substrate-binding protein [Teredinibacter turnerae]|uniref:ABC transporter substrate-binding protein n=1 Tax=Teredinibacter turnerae TaxID=2426 RepID=UPI0003AAE3BD|nr:ABC transporter substrate-binding protein [Teredinibacter turnerae]
MKRRNHLKLMFVFIVVVVAGGCGGSSSSAPDNTQEQQAQQENPTEPAIKISASLKWGETDYFRREEYEGIPITANYEGTYWMLLRGTYSVNRPAVDVKGEIKDISRSIVHTLKSDDDTYWLIQTENGGAGIAEPIYINESSAGPQLEVMIEMWGGKARVRTYKVTTDEIEARIENTLYLNQSYSISDSKITFIKISDTPKLADMWRNSVENLGIGNWSERWTYGGTAAERSYSDVPMHLFVHGYREERVTEAGGQVVIDDISEYVQVSSIQESLQSRLDINGYRYISGAAFGLKTSLSSNLYPGLYNRRDNYNGPLEVIYTEEPYNLDLNLDSFSFYGEFPVLEDDEHIPYPNSDRVASAEIFVQL